MSWNPILDPHVPLGAEIDSIDTVIVPRARDLGGFEVRRALPSPRRQMVGPFIFFDQFGPAEFLTGQGLDVRPHPHIGLSTVTYLFQGKMHHRDSLGTDAWIQAGDVNLMTAGHGITHSERTDEGMRDAPFTMSGIQSWIALPETHEDGPAKFESAAAADLPILQAEGKTVRLILGNAYGEIAPTPTPSQMFYADALLEAGAILPLPDEHEDRGIFILDGAIEIAGEVFEAGRMMVFRPGDAIDVTAGEQGARLMLLGGETMNGSRYIWWNFVASSQERIDAAKEAWRAGDWRHGRFQLPVGDDQEFMPLPD